MQISPDLWAEPKKAEQDNGGVQVVYEYKGQLVDAFHLSAEFAREHDVLGGIVPLPDEYPNWVQAVTIICQKCCEGKLGSCFAVGRNEDRRIGPLAPGDNV